MKLSFAQYVRLYLVAVPVFFLLDMLWFGLVAGDFYVRSLGALFGPVDWSAAVICYLLYVVGILVFVILPGLRMHASNRYVFFHGALFGFFVYAVFDLTNLSLIASWPLYVAFVDIAWGTTITALVSLISYVLARRYAIVAD